ncbi:hypothetical protein V8J88_07095 [Massilia sp. W12]|uniref:hypothetical protein n=1 Tax=Massilia sp. W12 TaxID=3126507 RepID=UPI0030D0E325
MSGDKPKDGWLQATPEQLKKARGGAVKPDAPSPLAQERALRAFGRARPDGLQAKLQNRRRGSAVDLRRALQLAAISGIPTAALPWLFASAPVAALCSVAALAAGAALGWACARKPAAAQAQDMLALAQQFDQDLLAHTAQLPEQARAVLAQIQAELTFILPLMAQDAPGLYDVQEAFFVRQSISAYLPQALKTYLQLPPPARDANAQAALTQQCALVLEKLQACSVNLRQGLQMRQAAHTEFLKQK